MDGEGEITFSYGDTYKGQWKDAKMHGKGFYKYVYFTSNSILLINIFLFVNCFHF